jgi:hypothetical protein
LDANKKTYAAKGCHPFLFLFLVVAYLMEAKVDDWLIVAMEAPMDSTCSTIDPCCYIPGSCLAVDSTFT